jgi:hypothetical protein
MVITPPPLPLPASEAWRSRDAAILCAVFALSAALAGCGACEPEPPPTLTAPSSSGAVAEIARAVELDATVAQPPGTPPPPGGGPRTTSVPCRAIAVDGDVRPDGDAGPALAAAAEIAPDRWLSLGPDTRLVAKDPRTGRETTFRGPGHVRACVDSLEESWLTSGDFEGTAGAGESPGAEEWVVTPLGVVRFGAAKLAVEASARRPLHASPPEAGAPRDGPALQDVRVTVGDGLAFVWAARDAFARGLDGGVTTSPLDEGWTRMSRGVAVLAPSVLRPPVQAARSAVDVCAMTGRSAHDQATSLLQGDAATGAKAARQFTTRRLARAACAVAALRVDALSEPGEKQKLAASLKEAADLWRALPLAR